MWIFFRMKCVLLRLRVYSFHPIAHSPFSNLLAKFHFYYFWGHIVLPTALSKHRSSLLTQIIRVYSDYPSLLRLSEFTQIIRVCSDYPSLLRLSEFTQFWVFESFNFKLLSDFRVIGKSVNLSRFIRNYAKKEWYFPETLTLGEVINAPSRALFSAMKTRLKSIFHNQVPSYDNDDYDDNYDNFDFYDVSLMMKMTKNQRYLTTVE